MLFIYDGVFVLRGFYPMGVLSYGAFVHGVSVLGGVCPRGVLSYTRTDDGQRAVT